MEGKYTLYIFKVVPPYKGYEYEFMGDVITQVSIFANSEIQARDIMIREFNSFLNKITVLERTEVHTLFTPALSKKEAKNQALDVLYGE